MNLLNNWKVIRKRLWLIILLAVISGSSAAYYTLQQPAQYRSTTTLFLNPAASMKALPFAIESGDRVQSVANTYTEFMRTRTFAELLSERSGIRVSELELRKWLTTEYVSGTQFFRIAAVHSDPKIAQQIAGNAAVLIVENSTRQQTQRHQNAVNGSDLSQSDQLQQSLQAELDYYNSQIKNMQTELAAKQEGAASERDNDQVALLRDALVDLQGLRVQVMTSLAQIQATLAANDAANQAVDTAIVVDAAQLPTAQLPRKLIEITLLAVTLSLMLGVTLAFVFEYMDYTVKQPEELDDLYGLPTQGVIGVLPRPSAESPLIVLSHSLSPAAEAFRALRTGIQVAGLNDPVHSLLVTSAVPAEGKSFVAANLAVMLAKSGLQVILVDADLRKPMLHKTFSLQCHAGLTDLVIDQQAVASDFLQRTEVKHLAVLPCGTVPRNPAELLGSRRMAQVMEQLQSAADIVVYDSPPVIAVTDAVVLAPRVGAVLQVIKAGHTRINLMLRCKSLLQRANARILGPVLNQVDQGGLDIFMYSYTDYDANVEQRAKRSALGRLWSLRWQRATATPANLSPDARSFAYQPGAASSKTSESLWSQTANWRSQDESA